MKNKKQSSDISIYAAVLTIFLVLMLYTISIKAQNTPVPMAEKTESTSNKPETAVAQNILRAQSQPNSQQKSNSQTKTKALQVDTTVLTNAKPGQLSAESSQSAKPTKVVTKKQTQATQSKKPHKVLIIIIDDVGYNLFQLEPFLKFPGPISFAILPSLDYTQKAESLINKAGKEILLHQPMEALGNLDAGPGAIMAAMDDATIQRVIADNLAQLPLARGINNHMGSLVSQDERIMAKVLDECRKAGLYYLDSVTIGNSITHKVARAMHFRIMERTVFLDNNPDKPSIQKQIREAAEIAEKRGYAVMIGHVWSNELAQTLIELYPHLIESGFNFSTISDFLMDFDDDEFDIGN